MFRKRTSTYTKFVKQNKGFLLAKVFMLGWVLLVNTANANANGCVVLLYHHFSDLTLKSTSISPRLFAQHLQYLQTHQFNVLPLKTMLDKLKTNNLPNKCVVLTADDAYLSIVKNAYPLLQKYQMPMSVFVATDTVDKNYKAMMDWQQMINIQGENIQFYNHSSTHAHLLDLSLAQVKSQIDSAQSRLQKVLNVFDKIFAYPYGEFNLDILEQVKNMGYVAFGQHSGVVSMTSNLQNLPRFPMAANYAKMDAFKLKVNTLPMPIVVNKINPIVTNNNPPILNLMFKKPLTKSAQQQLNCFADSKVKIHWKNNQEVSIVAKKPLVNRRQKYNCTMFNQEKSSYYWYSVQWVRPEIDE